MISHSSVFAILRIYIHSLDNIDKSQRSAVRRLRDFSKFELCSLRVFYRPHVASRIDGYRATRISSAQLFYIEKMELLFRFAAIIALLARIGVTYYCRHRALSVASSTATRTSAPSGHFTNANVMLFSNIWVTIAMTFWVTALIAFPDHSFS